MSLPARARVFAFVVVPLLIATEFDLGWAATSCIDYRDHLRLTSLGDPELAFSSYNGVATSGNFAFVADYNDLVVYDVSVPSAPEIVTTMPLNDPQLRPTKGIAVHGSRAFVFMGHGQFTAGRVTLVDIQNASNPAIITSIETPTSPWDIAITDEYAYVACAEGRFAILDVNPPQSAFLLSTVATGGGAVKGITLLNGVLRLTHAP